MICCSHNQIYNLFFVNKGSFIFMGRGVSGFWEGGASRNFQAKREGGPSQKLREEGGNSGKCTGLREHSRENWGGSCKIFQR